MAFPCLLQSSCQLLSYTPERYIAPAHAYTEGSTKSTAGSIAWRGPCDASRPDNHTAARPHASAAPAPTAPSVSLRAAPGARHSPTQIQTRRLGAARAPHAAPCPAWPQSSAPHCARLHSRSIRVSKPTLLGARTSTHTLTPVIHHVSTTEQSIIYQPKGEECMR